MARNEIDYLYPVLLNDRMNIREAVNDGRIDVIATDHAPHTIEEKSGDYLHAYAGLPLVQHGLQLMLHYHREGKITLEKVVEKMSHAPAKCFQIQKFGSSRQQPR